MSLAHPALNNIGKTKKRKFRNADEAKKFRELQQDWEKLQLKWGKPTNTQTMSKQYIPNLNFRGANEPRIPSKNSDADLGQATKPEIKMYTGTKVKGISTLHKSNAVPVFSDEEIQDISRMRR